jgi:integrase/recombinase XerD
MKHLIIQTPQYQLYIRSFGQWLETLGYSEATVSSMPSVLKEFLHYCETKSVRQTAAITTGIIKGYIEYVQTRKNHRKEGALSTSYINSHIRMLQQFSNYLRQTEQIIINIPVQHIAEEKKTDHVILTIEEIKQLWQATDETPYGMRDRAMLAVYYGCGLRKSEGIYLEVSDILFERKLLYIRKAKNNYERYVPITKNNLQWLEQWICNGRHLLLPEHSKDTALFISERGNRISAGMMYVRLKALVQKAGIQKETGLHTLRHSIATHLLQKGMELENIALLLGHRSLDSTQMYTHILNETL